MQLRSLFIGIIYQILFKQKLTFYQWISMVVLTFGTMTKEFTIDGGLGITLSSAIPFIAIQIVCSCTASVYNEYLLKSRNVDFWVQNLFFYTNSILINFFIFISTNDLALNHIDPILQPPGNTQFLIYLFVTFLVLLIILNLVLIGITTSMFLKHLNAILKNFASGMFFIVNLT